MRRNKEDGGSTDESKCQSENVGRTSDDSLSVWVVDSTSEFMEAHWATLRFLTRCFPVLGLLWWLRSSNCYRRYDSLPEYLESTPENEINTRKLRGFVVHLDVKSGYIHVLHTPLLRRIFGIHPSDANLEHHTLKVSMAFVRTVPQYSEEATRAFEEALLRKFITLQFVDLSKSSKNKNPRCIIWKRPVKLKKHFFSTNLRPLIRLFIF